ncbi:hypothetical protein [Sphingobacterium sp. BIGb0165]|uniref:hypothetical protein n=1 Tax=Sphingobacterium sp. BIGb0165 TaxID=2940615 RepID=UPI00216A5C6A|nr:hypothetical protein [Sphingobacterium sp. BIGb0165]
MKIKMLKINRGSVVVELDGSLLKISGEAMLPKSTTKLSVYVLYKDSLKWLGNDIHPTLNEEELIAFIEKEFLNRKLSLIIE